MDQRLTVITLGVDDIDISREFYSNTLGWIPESDLGEIIFYDLGGYLLALYTHKGLAGDIPAARTSPLPAYRGFTLAYNTNSEEEVDEVFKGLKAKGVTIAKEPQKTFWGGYSGYFLDPNGHAWEVAYNPSWRIRNKGRFERISSGD